ncbi:MAG TPA: sigma-70 family RNA polymerase sigma factor [Verrucomicrobiae bacterium]|nr:sigma-70 family RNA polymerase sigma factor [Verrucomicrobiae bacterium]
MQDGDEPNRAEWIRLVLAQQQGPLLRYAARITGDIERARDVVQDTFLRLCRERPERLNSHLTEWLFTVCRNRALDVVRKESRTRTLTEIDLSSRQSDEPSPALTAERRETTGELLQAIDDLPANQQEVIQLKFQNDLSYREISRITNLSVSNVGFLIHTGIKTLRQRVRALEGVSHED